MTLHLDIDAHGRVVPQSDPARRALADRAGRFVLLPSVGDLVVARRTPATGGASERPRCVVAGDVAAFPIADFIAFMQQSRLSGVLTVFAGGAERSIAFQDGEVRSAHSSAPGERIGEVAVRLGYATEAQVAEATRSGRALGKALVDLGILKPNDLYRCLHEQVAAVFHAVLLSTSRHVHPRGRGAGARRGAAVRLDAVAPHGRHPAHRRAVALPGADPGAGRGPAPARADRAPMTLRPTENALLALVDGRRTVAEIATAAHLNEFDATKILVPPRRGGLRRGDRGDVRARVGRRARPRHRRRG